MKTQAEYFGVKRGLSVAKVKDMQNCLTVTADVDGKRATYEVCAVGNKEIGAQISVGRAGKAGRRGAGLSACSAKGAQSKCVTGGHMILRAGGGGAYRRKGITVLNGMRRRR